MPKHKQKPSQTQTQKPKQNTVSKLKTNKFKSTIPKQIQRTPIQRRTISNQQATNQ